MKSSLVIVYHRQPYEEVVVDGQTEYRENKSPNGIVPTLKSFFGSVSHGSWVAWKEAEDPDDPDFPRRVEIADQHGDYTVSRLGLTKEQVSQFYHVTSKEALWPILHSFPQNFNYDAVDWENFRDVNRRFAEAACEEAEDDALIWIHDYNLWLCPGMIREIKPNAKIAFFHHTPFPSADIFNILPWREEIVDSLLACDMVGFHIPRYSQNFVSVARALRGVEVESTIPVEATLSPSGTALSEPEMAEVIVHGGRRILLDAFPVGTNPELIDQYLSTDAAAERIAKIRREIGQDQTLILSVGRTDYTKGTKELLDAYDRLLDRRPELRGKVKLMVTSVQANQNMTVYRETQAEVDQMVGSIHGKYATLDWGPIMHFSTPIPFEELVCYFNAADICWTTPLRDGLNLVAKEYVASHRGEGGVLVLSEFTGVAAELQHAVPTNPYASDSLADGIDRALAMDSAEQRTRMAEMYANVCKYDIGHWAEHIFRQFDRVRPLASHPDADAAE